MTWTELTIWTLLLLWAAVASFGWDRASSAAKRNATQRDTWHRATIRAENANRKSCDRVDALTRAIADVIDTPPRTRKRAKAWAALLSVVGQS